MDKNRFSQFEERVQALVEGGFARLFAGRLHPREVALRLARAMEDNTRADDRGSLVAPNRYAVHLHPEDYAALLESQPDLAAMMSEHLIVLARASGYRLDSPPIVVLVSDPEVALHSAVVMAQHVEDARQATQALDPILIQPGGDEESPRLPPAFLVVNGDRYVSLDRTVINIGRRRDNTIVLDDLRVSRQHCQLRYRFGQFVLYDLGSRGGTFVNNARVSECVLRTGDVISLAGVKLVYMVEEGTTGRTSPGGDTAIYLNQDDLRGPEHDDVDGEEGW